jgi:hypothetical protein
MKRISFVSLIIIGILVVTVSFSMAEKKKGLEKKIAPAMETEKVTESAAPATETKTLEVKPTMEMKLPPKADLRVDVIHSSRCPCDMAGVDAFYVPDIMVDVSNGGGAETTSTLVVTYTDVFAGPQTITKSVSALKGYPTNPWAIQMFKVLDRPALVKKSTGIKAEIKVTSPTMDTNPANNTKTVNECDMMVY